MERQDITKIKLLVRNSAIAEVNDLKILNLGLWFCECKFFTFINLNPTSRSRLILK